MNRVVVIGCPGSGKTTFSIKLAALVGLPLIHLDALYHNESWSLDENTKKIEWTAMMNNLVASDLWIIDGNYKSTMEIRMEAADTIIFLDYPRYLSLWRVLVRRFKFRNTQRPDMPTTWKERISWDFMKLIWNYGTEQRPTVLKRLESYSKHKTIYILTRPEDVGEFFITLKIKKTNS